MNTPNTHKIDVEKNLFQTADIMHKLLAAYREHSKIQRGQKKLQMRQLVCCTYHLCDTRPMCPWQRSVSVFQNVDVKQVRQNLCTWWLGQTVEPATVSFCCRLS